MIFLFKPLQESHFPLLLKWLETPHVKTWWDSDVQWTYELIKDKYGSYVLGFKLEKGMKKPIQAYVFYADEAPIGYIQLYNVYDFSRDYPESLGEWPDSLAALDFFIGEVDYLGKRLPSLVLKKFLQDYVDPCYDACLIDPEMANNKAIHAYKKAGFKPVKTIKEGDVLWMMRKKQP